MKRIALGDAAEIISGATPRSGVPEYWGGEVNWATPADLASLDGPYLASTPRTLTPAGLAKCSAKVLPVGAVLLSSRAPIGHVAIAAVPMATNQGFKSLVPVAGILDAKYLFHWLRANKAYLQSLGNGATFKEISKSVVARIEIPLPSLDEQRRIAAILDWEDSLRGEIRRTILALDALRESMLSEYLPEGPGRRVALGEIATVKGGKRLPKGSLYASVITSHPYIRVSDLSNGRIEVRDLRYIEDTTHASVSRYVVGQDDVIISIAGTIGAVATVPAELVGANLTENAAVVRPIRTADYRAAWLAHVLRSRSLQAQIRSHVGQVTIGKLALFRIEKLELDLPPLRDQDRLLGSIAQIELQRARLQRAIDLHDELFASLESRAFRGEL